MNRRLTSATVSAIRPGSFQALDFHVWKLTYKWARHTHSNKSKWWICNRYFDMFNKFRKDRWVFGARTVSTITVPCPT